MERLQKWVGGKPNRENLAASYEYVIYVKKADYERAAALVHA